MAPCIADTWSNHANIPMLQAQLLLTEAAIASTESTLTTLNVQAVNLRRMLAPPPILSSSPAIAKPKIAAFSHNAKSSRSKQPHPLITCRVCGETIPEPSGLHDRFIEANNLPPRKKCHVCCKAAKLAKAQSPTSSRIAPAKNKFKSTTTAATSAPSSARTSAASAPPLPPSAVVQPAVVPQTLSPVTSYTPQLVPSSLPAAPQLPPNVPPKQCASCGFSKAKMDTCSKCHVASYCNEACQKTDWPRHRDACADHARKVDASRWAGSTSTPRPPSHRTYVTHHVLLIASSVTTRLREKFPVA